MTPQGGGVEIRQEKTKFNKQPLHVLPDATRKRRENVLMKKKKKKRKKNKNYSIQASRVLPDRTID